MSLVPDTSHEALRATCLVIRSPHMSEGGGHPCICISEAALNIPSKNTFKYFSTSLTKYISVGPIPADEGVGGRRFA